MTNRTRIILGVGVFALVVLTLAAPEPTPAQDSREQAWIKSGDPCWPTDQAKAQIKAMTGITADYLKCKPVRITMEWDIDEVFHHHSGLGDDRLRAKVRASFKGNIQTTLDQQKRSQVNNYAVHSPAPCCPGIATVEPLSLQASILGWKPKGFSGQEFKTFELSGGAEILTRTDKPGFFGIRWGRGGIDCVTEMNGPWIKLAKGSIPKPYSCGSPVWIMDQHNYHLGKPVAPPTWDELKPYYDKQEIWRKEYAFQDRTDFPTGPGALSEYYAIQGTVKVEVDFAAEETEDWLLSVEGQETDANGQDLGSPLAADTLKSQPPAVAFDWGLGAKLRARKRKGIRTLEAATITKFDQAPKLVFDPQSPYTCGFIPCPGGNAYEKANAFVGMLASGSIQGETVNVRWPHLPAQACLTLTPKGSSSTKKVLRREYGSKEFTDEVSRVILPLKDGATKTGNLGKWLTYKLTLKKLS